MTMHRTRRPQFFYTTAPLPCPYLPGRTERKIVTELLVVTDNLDNAVARTRELIAREEPGPGIPHTGKDGSSRSV